jgi:hypothetical protein
MTFPSAITPKGWLIIAIVWVCLAGFIELNFWRGKLAPLKTRAARRTLRVLFYGLPGVATLLVAVVSIRPVWHWYSVATETDLFGLGIIATGAVTVWAGSLVAFTISKRVTPRRAFGLRLVLFALLIAVLPIALSGALLRSAFLTITLGSAVLGRFQVSLLSAFKETKFFVARGNVTTKPEEPTKMPPWASGTEAFADWMVSFVHGGPYWLAMAVGSLVIFVFPSPRTVTTIAGIALLWGMRLIYRSIVDPFTPQFFGDSLETWKNEHFTTEPSPNTPPAIGQPPSATKDE